MIMVPTAVIMDYLPPKRLTKLSLSYHLCLKYSAFWLEALRFRDEAEEEIALKYGACTVGACCEGSRSNNVIPHRKVSTFEIVNKS